MNPGVAVVASTLRQQLRADAARLAAVADQPLAEAEMLWAEVLGCTRAQLIARDAGSPDEQSLQTVAALIARRAAGEPMAYLLGRRGFWTLELDVGPAVLVPRPETETLVEWALQLLEPDAAQTIADLGTGSGAIALAVAVERPQAQIIATDASRAALDVASRNAQRLGVHKIEFRQGHWYAPLAAQRCALLLSNPPYIADGDPHLPALRHEPRSALVAGADGLADLRQLIAGAGAHLTGDGWLLLEHGATQAQAVRDLLSAAGFADVETRSDLAGLPRISGGRWPA